MLKTLALAALALPLYAGLNPADFPAYIEAARIAWGVDVTDPVVIRVDALNPCKLSEKPHIAELQWIDTITTMTFDDPDVKPEVSHQMTYVIRINGNCNWDKLNIAQTILHEYGHIVISPEYHSQDKHSIMFFAVSGDQKITAADRAAITAKADH